MMMKEDGEIEGIDYLIEKKIKEFILESGQFIALSHYKIQYAQVDITKMAHFF